MSCPSRVFYVKRYIHHGKFSFRRVSVKIVFTFGIKKCLIEEVFLKDVSVNGGVR